MEKYLITVNQNEIPVDKKDAGSLDIVRAGEAGFHLLHDNKSYVISILNTDYHNKSVSLSINGNPYEVKIQDEFDQRLKEMGLLAVSSQRVNSINAPMPGLIMDIMVQEGQEITEGTPLLVLSAMKMENILLSHGEGIVKNIAVKKDDAVEKGQLIIEME
jgi:biotin carboxyl carrier protein